MMSEISEHANYLLNEYGRLQFDYAAYCKLYGESLRNEARNNLETYIAALEAENRALRHSLELRECEEMEHKPDPLEGVPYVSFSNEEIAAMTPDHPFYKLVRSVGND